MGQDTHTGSAVQAITPGALHMLALGLQPGAQERAAMAPIPACGTLCLPEPEAVLARGCHPGQAQG